MEPDYLTDKQGAPDPEVQRLEGLLSDARYKKPSPGPMGVSQLSWAAAGVAALLMPSILILALAMRGPSSPLTYSDGVKSKLQHNVWLHTGEKTAELTLDKIGSVRISPHSKVKIVAMKEDTQQLELKRGELHAKVIAPPRLFVVNTPLARAVDLGCEYVLRVTEEGTTELRVISGAVSMERQEHQVLVPQGFSAVTRPIRGTGIPFRADSASGFREALKAIEDTESAATVPQELIATLLRESKKMDAPTLFELMKRVPESNRRVVAEQLAALIPPKSGVVNRVLQHDATALTEWWEEIYNSYDVP